MKILVDLNKNLTLIYCLLNRFGQAYGAAKHPLRLKIQEHFKDYAGSSPSDTDYIHEHKLVVWALHVSDAPAFSLRVPVSEKDQWHFDKGASIRPYLEEFYKTTDFEDYYTEQILPDLAVIKNNYDQFLEKYDFVRVLETSWGTTIEEDLVIIPNPFTQGSFGPSIGGINYQVIGEISDSAVVHNILHEGSHPIAKKILAPFVSSIEEHAYLLQMAQNTPNFPNAYNKWHVCFEEHLIRAVQVAKINPQVKENYNELKGLEKEKQEKGMVFIDIFYDCVKKYPLAEAIPHILRALNKRY